MISLSFWRNGVASTVAPKTAIGPNTYLSDRDFWRMFGAAFMVHLVVIAIASLLPDDEVTNIPVRAISFKIGDSAHVPAYTAPSQIAAPVMQATAEPELPVAATERIAAKQPMPKPAPKPTPKPVKPQKLESPVKPPAPKPVPAKQFDPMAEQKPQGFPLHQAMQPAIAEAPQQFVREVGAPTPQAVQNAVPESAGDASVADEKTTQEIRDRYEQQISGWIQRHKIYPPEAGGREGRVIVRMRIDRTGAVRYYALEQTSGVTGIDNAALDMIRRANPVPAVPANYPAGNLIEFLIPITFHAPR